MKDPTEDAHDVALAVARREVARVGCNAGQVQRPPDALERFVQTPHPAVRIQGRILDEVPDGLWKVLPEAAVEQRGTGWIELYIGTVDV